MRKLILYLLILIILHLICSCATPQWKASLVAGGDINVAVNNSINDFVYTSKYFNMDSVFSVTISDIDDEILMIGIIAADEQIYPHEKHKIGAYDEVFPTRYTIKDDKLFYWNDPRKSISRDILSVLEKYNHIDYEWSKVYAIPPMVHNDGEEGVIYYICKSNYKNYKKTGVSNINKRYKTPIVKCNDN